jgi:hypothetical protein
LCFASVWFPPSSCVVFVLWRLLGLCSGPRQLNFWRLLFCIAHVNAPINQLTIIATCNRTCWTTWRKPRGVVRKKNPTVRMPPCQCRG